MGGSGNSEANRLAVRRGCGGAGTGGRDRHASDSNRGGPCEKRVSAIGGEPDPDDRRAKRIIITEPGQACVAAALNTIATLEAELESLLGSTARAELHDTPSQIITAGRTSREAL